MPVRRSAALADCITFPFWPADYVVPAGASLRLVLDADDNLTQGGGNGGDNILLDRSRLVIPDAASREAEAALLG